MSEQVEYITSAQNSHSLLKQKDLCIDERSGEGDSYLCRHSSSAI